MIILELTRKISPIFLTVILIVYLMIAELGSEKIKKDLFPLLAVLLAVFSVVVVQDIMSKL
jgi:hypothetical protein